MQARTNDRLTPSPLLAIDLLTEKDLAAMARVSTALLQKLRRNGGGPAFVRIGSAVRYPASVSPLGLNRFTRRTDGSDNMTSTISPEVTGGGSYACHLRLPEGVSL